MRLIGKTKQYRRDFVGIYECEGCGTKNIISRCYDDRNYHDNVAPNIKCSNCLQSTNSLGVKIEFVPTKYLEGVQV